MKIKHIAYILLFFLTSVSLYAQPAQKETLILHTDRDVYNTGEVIRYKLYVLNKENHQITPLSSEAYLVIRGANKSPFYKQRVDITSQTANGCIQLPDSLPSGMYQLSAFTNAMRNDGENIFSSKEFIIANRFDSDLSFKISEGKELASINQNNEVIRISLNKTSFHPREKVQVSLQNTNSDVNLSISVSEKSIFNFANQANSINNKNATKNTKPSFYPIEKNGKILYGTVYDETTNKPVANAMVMLSCIDTVANLKYYKTDTEGRFYLDITPYYRGKKLYLTIQNVPDNKSWKLKIDRPLEALSLWQPVNFSPMDNEMKDYLTTSQKMADINLAYYPNENSALKISIDNAGICPQFYHCKPTTIKPSDYTALNNFREICVEILPQVRFFKENGKSKLSIQGNNIVNSVNNSTSAIFLDGVFLDDLEKIATLNSDKIKKIEIVYNERAFGDFIYNGALSIFTKKNEIENMIPAPYSLIYDDALETMEFQSINEIYNPAPQDKKLPFFKQLLYWNPQVKSTSNEKTTYEFFTPDNAGIFIINIKGITKSGIEINQNIEFEAIN